MNTVETESVRCRISFPLIGDEKAVSRAISRLLNEGWEFIEVRNKTIALGRGWDWEPPTGQEEERSS